MMKMWSSSRTILVVVLTLGQLPAILGHFLNEWAVQVKTPEEADRIAKELNCINAGKIT